MGQKTAYAHFCNVKRHSIKSNISRCAQLVRRRGKAGRGRPLPASRSLPSALPPAGRFWTAELMSVGWQLCDRPPVHTAPPPPARPTVCEARRPLSCLLSLSGRLLPPPATPSHGSLRNTWKALLPGEPGCGPVPELGRERGTERDSQPLGWSEPLPSTEYARGPAPHPQLSTDGMQKNHLWLRMTHKLPEGLAHAQVWSPPAAPVPSGPQRPLRLQAPARRTWRQPLGSA